MAESIQIPARSNHGCWTCRLRRKKCDENHPICSVCASLELDCHGYGPRPCWMDNGPLQREQAAKFKGIVNRTVSRKRQQHSSVFSLPPLTADLSDTPIDNFLTSPAPVSDAIFGQQPAWAAYIHNEHPPPSTMMDFNHATASDQTWGTQQLGDVPAFETPLHIDPESHSVEFEAGQTEFTGSSISPTSAGAMRPQSSNLPAPWGRGGNNVGGGASSRKVNAFLEYGTLDTDFRYVKNGSAHHHGSCPHGSSIRSSSAVSAASNPGIRGNTEDSLFMHYLDQVFYVQYPFYQSRSSRGRGWLLSIMRKVKAVYHGALALSEQHMLHPFSRSNDMAISLAQLRGRDSHYDLALREVQVLVNESPSSTGFDYFISNLDILAALLQLLYFELFAGGSGNWQAYLYKANNFIPALHGIKTPAAMLSSTDLEPAKDQLLEIMFNPELAGAVNTVLGSFVVFDIIASASTRSPPVLNVDHLQTLTTSRAVCESLTGCSSSVMALLLEICRLDHWKGEAQKAQRLSVLNLVQQGNKLQERLQQELAAIEVSSNSTRDTSTRSLPDMTKIFALSAVTYLHVVIAGACPELPEIAESVAETIRAIQALDNPKLIRHIVWPFCVSGSLSMDEHHNFFRGLVSEAGFTKWTAGACYEALEIMETCWNARKSSLDFCDWATVISQRDVNILLL